MSAIAIPTSQTSFCSQAQLHPEKHLLDMRRVATIILGGGQGSRLMPLTMTRCKPAISFGGRYRLIDIPISNAINSGSQKIFIITQFLSSSLHQHILSTYRFGSFSSGSIELLSAEEKHAQKTWFQGTADAVRQNIQYFRETPADYFLILSGDQLYHMDFSGMLEQAVETDADVVIACLPINQQDTQRMGVMQIDDAGLITNFKEKPQNVSDIETMRLSPEQALRFGTGSTKELDYLGSMGIYLFKRQALFDLLANDPREDFGKHLIPTKVSQGNIAAYIHQGYWEDIGTIGSFYQANMALTEKNAQFDCYREDWRIFASPISLPGACLYDSQVDRSILCEGTVIDSSQITRSIVGPRVQICSDSLISNTYILGNDFFRPPVHDTGLPSKFQIGSNCLINNAIIDKHVCIGNHVKLINQNKLTHYDSPNVYIRDGIIIVPRGASIPDGYVL